MLMQREATLIGRPVCAAPIVQAQATAPFRFALTAVFLDNDAAVVSALREALAAAMGQDIEQVQRRLYQEITGILLDGSVDAARTCGHPFTRRATSLRSPSRSIQGR